MTINNKKLTIGIFAALILAALLVLYEAAPAKANIYTGTILSQATTSAQFSITTSARILSTTTNTLGSGFTRVYTSICNQSSIPVGLNMDQDKATNGATGNVTTYIAAAAGYSACYEISDRNMYQGSITASSTSQAAVQVTVKDYVQ